MTLKAKPAAYPQKRTMNLYYRPDRTTKPATASLYILFFLVVLLALAKLLIYDSYVEVRDARSRLAALESQQAQALAQLTDYDEVAQRYSRFSRTPQEEATVDRLAVLELLDQSVKGSAVLDSVTISGDTAAVRLSGVSLAETADIAQRLEQSPLVAATTVNTASTADEKSTMQVSIIIALQKEETK